MIQTETKQVGSISNDSLNFYGTVINRLQNKNLYGILSEIKLQSDEEKIHLTNTQFEVLGGISYLIGLDFISMNSWNKNILKNVFTRLNLNKVNFKTFDRFKKTITKYNDFEIYNEAKDNLLKRISSDVKFSDPETINQIDYQIKTIINNSLVPNNYAQLVKDNYLIQKETYSYHDLLVFNNLFYENLIIDKKGIVSFIELTENPEYNQALKLSSEYFEDQKFALMYMDSIVSLIQKINAIDDNNSWYLNDKLFEMCLDIPFTSTENLIQQIENRLDLFEEEFNPTTEIKMVEPKEIQEVEPAPLSNIVENLEQAQVNPLENPTEVIQQILFDYNKICKETFDTVFDFKNNPEELIKMLNSMLTAEDIIGSFFIFLKKYAEFKNTDGVVVNEIKVEEIFNYTREELVKALNDSISGIQEKYSTILKDYVAEVNNENGEELKETINKLINSLHISNTEDKGILVSQISENIVVTNKHLHEILTCIDRQYINGSEIDNYIALGDLLNDKFNTELGIFEETAILEDYQLQVTLQTAFKATL